MEAEASRTLSDLADNRAFIFCTYFLGIGAWAVIAKHDFISSNWKTVRETRQSGQAHIIIVVLPMLYVGFYIYVLALKSDFKLGAAVFAFAFASLHLFRTIIALWQLTTFKKWAISAIHSIESLGYYARASNGQQHPLLDKTTTLDANINESRIDFIVDQITVNNTIIENKLSSGAAVCRLLFLSDSQKSKIAARRYFIQRAALRIYYFTGSIIRLPLILIPLLLPNAWEISGEKSTPYLKPYFSEEIFLRWACVLIANTIPDWLVDMRKVCYKNESIYCEKREAFAKELLLSAALHLRRQQDGPDNVLRTDLSHSFLPYEKWKTYPKLCKGLFSREEFLKIACNSGKGLPFHAPHHRAHSLSKYGESYNYTKFSSWLTGSNVQLDAELEEVVKELGTTEVEWLAVFLSVDDWKGHYESKGQKIPSRTFFPDNGVDKNGFAIRNLANQLGFSALSEEFLQQFSHPLLKGTSDCNVWHNRNALELSAHIDNWLALRSGEKTEYMMRQMRSQKTDFLLSEISASHADVSETIFQRNVQLKIDESMFQFSQIEPEHHNFEHSMTFLGCAMESLRSSLARWTENNQEEQMQHWEPEIDYEMQNKVFMLSASEDFMCCAHSIEDPEILESKFFQLRLLWELQNFFHAQIDQPAANTAYPARLDVIILCILSFPSLSVHTSRVRFSDQIRPELQSSCCIQIEDESKAHFELDQYRVTIEAGCGPQRIYINVSFEMKEKLIYVRLAGDAKTFSWDSWKNAFLGRLEGARKWQEGWNMPAPHVLRTNSKISAGISKAIVLSIDERETINIWKGWLPHKISLCQYELESPGFIKRRIRALSKRDLVKKEKLYLGIQNEQESYVPVDYTKADPSALRRASALAIEALLHATRDGENSRLHRGDGEGRFRQRAAKITGYPQVELTLLRISSVSFGNVADLRKAIKLMLETGDSEDAVILIERFYTANNSYNDFFNSNDKVIAVEELFQESLEISNYSAKVALPFARFYTTACFYNREEMYGRARNMLFKSMIENVRENDKKSALECRFALQNLLRTDRPEEISFARSSLVTTIDHSLRFRQQFVEGTRGVPFVPDWSFLTWLTGRNQDRTSAAADAQVMSYLSDGEEIEIESGLADARYTLNVLNEKTK